MSQAFSRLAGRIRDADAVTAELLSEVIREVCSRLPSVRRTQHFKQLGQYIQSCAWTDAVLVLLALELPQWQVRRIVYDSGEWHCALSRQRELPDWVDQSVEACHADLALAILSALVDVQRVGTFPTETASVPAFRRTEPLYVPFCCDNFA
jgi:hypothetical protein